MNARTAPHSAPSSKASAALFTLVLMALPPEAGARELELTWDAPAACGELAAVRERVQQLMGRQLAADAEETLAAHVRIEQRGERGWTSRIDIVGEDGTAVRELQMDSCEDLVEAAALVLSLALSPPSPRRLKKPAPSETELWLAGGLGLGVGQLPALASRLQVGAELTYRALQLELSAVHGFAQRTLGSQSRPDAGIELQLLFAGGLRACLQPWRDTWTLGVCAGGELGALRGRGVGISAPVDGTGLWASALGSVRAGLKVTGSAQLRAEVGLGVALSRPSFVVDGLGALYQPPWVHGHGSLNLAVRLW